MTWVIKRTAKISENLGTRTLVKYVGNTPVLFDTKEEAEKALPRVRKVFKRNPFTNVFEAISLDEAKRIIHIDWFERWVEKNSA
jgi:hypothetical protein